MNRPGFDGGSLNRTFEFGVASDSEPHRGPRETICTTAPGATPGEPGAIVRGETPLSIEELQAHGYIVPDTELPGTWQVTNWAGFDEMATYGLEERHAGEALAGPP